MRIIVLFLITCFTLTACSGNWSDYPSRNQSNTMIDNEQIIGTNDKVRVYIFDENDISGEYVVLQDGTIQIPLIGEIVIEGLNLTDAARLIEKTLIQKGYLINPKVTLSIAQAQTVKIMGEIQSTGEYPYQEGLTVLGLVAKAGGFSYRARQSDFDIIRKMDNGEEEVIKGDISTLVKAGDIIRVRERYF